MKNRGQLSKIQVRIHGEKDQIDGLMEILVGMFVMSNVLKNYKASRRDGRDGESYIYLDLETTPPPLGNLGENDLPPYTGDNP